MFPHTQQCFPAALSKQCGGVGSWSRVLPLIFFPRRSQTVYLAPGKRGISYIAVDVNCTLLYVPCNHGTMITYRPVLKFRRPRGFTPIVPQQLKVPLTTLTYNIPIPAQNTNMCKRIWAILIFFLNCVDHLSPVLA